MSVARSETASCHSFIVLNSQSVRPAANSVCPACALGISDIVFSAGECLNHTVSEKNSVNVAVTHPGYNLSVNHWSCSCFWD